MLNLELNLFLFTLDKGLRKYHMVHCFAQLGDITSNN